jgi:hypothetical protein
MRRTGQRQCRLCKKHRTLNNLKSRLCSECEPTHAVWKERKDRERATRVAAYDALVDLRGERCEICNREPVTRRLNVDHDHKTGNLRGLLCYRCNYGLDWFADDPERLRRAADYLEQKQLTLALKKFKPCDCGNPGCMEQVEIV